MRLAQPVCYRDNSALPLASDKEGDATPDTRFMHGFSCDPRSQKFVFFDVTKYILLLQQL